ncbi:M15 family metallopeptidase [Massilia sp. TS11]|uniref:M15 family metallopeptidase n=1 Tax=Massilia sp. TS11 TaxID=2908003 RepID=UPI001ED9FB75|nr:M15 family metallopeptidase [Massilia sp. TS11]
MLICVAFLVFFILAALLWSMAFPAETGLWRLQLRLKTPIRFIRRHPWQLAAGIALLMLPLALALWLGGEGSLPEPEERAGAPDPLVLELLRGEQLVPPVPLPPDIFTTREVEAIRPLLGEASRNWTQLDADYRQRLLLVFRWMHERYGYDMTLIEGYRSAERQNRLASLGPQVTNARAFQSYHQFGLAGDSAFIRDGKLVISERDPWAARGYQLFGALAEAAGLTWGGRWAMADLGHTELRRPTR